MSQDAAPLAETRAATLIQMNTATLEAYVKAASEATGLPVAETYLNGVVEHFAVATRMADKSVVLSIADEVGIAPTPE